MRHRLRRFWGTAALTSWTVVGVWAATPDSSPTAIPIQDAPGASSNDARCRVDGRVSSGTLPLPGATIVVQVGSTVKAATSTDADGKFTIVFTPNATYRLSADLTAFSHEERELVLGAAPCDSTVNFMLSLKPRGAAAAQAAATAGSRRGSARPSTAGGDTEAATQPAQEGSSTTTPTPASPAGTASGRRGRANAGTAANGRGGQRFQTLTVEADAAGSAALEAAPAADGGDVARLLPPGFSADAVQGDAIAINGSGDATNVNRGFLNDRQQAIRLGQLDPATGQFAPGFGAPAGGPLPGLDAADGGRGRGGFAAGGRGGGRGGFVLGGRGARSQNPYQGSATYTFGGSALDTPPYQLRSAVPDTQPQFAQNTFGATVGGPLKLPGLYSDTNRRTNFQLNYTGNQSNNVFDQYATVPTDAMRAGDFSASPIQLIDPKTQQPFAGNIIPAGRIDPTAQALLGYIPAANLPGATRNYHTSTLAHTSSDNFSLRLTQNLSPNVQPGGRGGGGFRGGGGGRFGGPGGPGGRGGARGTNIFLTGQLQYRRTETEGLNVFPGLGSTTTNTSISAPISLNIVRNRTVQNFTVNVTHATVDVGNAFSGVNNVAGNAGILYPSGAATDPLNWGVPNLSFSGFTGLRSAGANERTDDRITTSYFWAKPIGRHQVRIGGDYRHDLSSTESNSNARGSYIFTGLYSSGLPVAGQNGSDFADFLLGAPSQASLQVSGLTHLRQHAFDAYVEDNWQKSAKLTFNLGLRYELALPYVEANGQMANLDVTPMFTAATPVVAGGVGPYTGAFPAGLINADTNNLGPRLGVAYRVLPKTVLRAGYSITYNSSSYASIARQLAGQPPFGDTATVTDDDPSAPLTIADALLASTGTSNNYGVDRDYALGTIQTWNAAISRDIGKDWNVMATYTGTKGTNLDILRAPNRGLDGLLIPDVQAFTWESSGGHSILNAGNFQVRRRLAGGFAGDLSYTLAKSMDNASSLGAGQPVVAQNDKDLGAEYALSNFDRRHQISGDFMVELPFGSDRHWLKDGGLLSSIVGNWTATLNLTIQSGTPLTARVVGDVSDVTRGVNGALRADTTGEAIQLTNPLVDEFFNTAAFTTPAAGQFGDAGRNSIIGPGTRQLNGALIRDLRLSGNRVVSLQVNATNLLNTVQWATVDTNVNSQTFGQVLSARPMRTITVGMRFRF
jgi:hypothetical protein